MAIADLYSGSKKKKEGDQSRAEREGGRARYAHLLAFRGARSCRRWAAASPQATILASARRPRLIDLESRALPCTPTLHKEGKHVTHLFRQSRGEGGVGGKRGTRKGV
jgi:hypothetical protein